MTGSIDRDFDAVAKRYARYRPVCPESLVACIAEQCSRRGVCWEPGCGSGQVTPLLSAHFDHVLATDPAEHAIEHCPKLEGVTFRVGTCESCALDGGSVDLIASGQAAHWFDMDAFAREARRVAAPGCIVALWCYELPRVTTAIDAAVDRLYGDILGPFWAAGRRHIDAGYADLDFPFTELPVDVPPYEAQWNADDMLGYLRTWSAGVAFAKAGHGDAVGKIEDDLRSAWEDSVRQVHWPVALRLGVIE